MSAAQKKPFELSYDIKRGTKVSLPELLVWAIHEINRQTYLRNKLSVSIVVDGQIHNWEDPLNCEQDHLVAFVIENKDTKEINIAKISFSVAKT